MEKKVLKVFCLFLAMLILMATSVCADEVTVGVGVGDYFLFGTYGGESILWRCVDVDSNGALLMTDRAITKKAYDADGTLGSHSRGNDRTSGSNYWADSNIRSWLNSDAAAGEVVWLCGNAPVNNSVSANPYDNEAGFLSGFTEDEKSLIKEVTQKSILDQNEYSDMTSYGDAAHIQKTSIAEVVQNYDTAYGHNVADKIFLLDVKQIKAVYDNRSILGDNYYIAKDTNGALCRSWLRTPRATLTPSTNVRYITTYGYVDKLLARYGDMGVRPGFYLSETALIDTGDGSLENPYTVTAPAASVGGLQLSVTLPAHSGGTVARVITTVRNTSGKVTAVSFDTVTLSASESTSVTITIENTAFNEGDYFDIFVSDTKGNPIIDAEHYVFGYVNGLPALIPYDDINNFNLSPIICSYDGGYYGETRNDEKISADVVFNSFYIGLEADRYGMFIYVSSEENTDKKGVNLTFGNGLTDGKFNAVIRDIKDLNAIIVAIPYVVTGEYIQYGEACTANVADFTKWLGSVKQ